MVRVNRILKGTLSIGLLLGTVGFYANNRFNLTASYAVVAGPAVTLRAPIDGALSHSLRSFSIVPAGTQVGSVAPTAKNDPELRAATAELQVAQSEVASITQLIAIGEEMRSKSQTRQSVLGSRRTEHLRRLVELAEADLATKKAGLEGAQTTRKRSGELCAQGLLSTLECETLDTRVNVGSRELAAAGEHTGIARFLLDATRAGADVGQDVGSEVTYVRQQRDELTLRLATLRQQLQTRQAQAKALELRVNPPAVPVAVSARSRVWSVLHQAGTLVVRGDPLFQIVSCDQLFVFAAVSEDRYARLRIGMAAEVEVGDKTYHGKIVQLLGPYGTFSQNGNMQPQPPVILNNQDASNAAVAVDVPELASAMSAGCEIGRRASVHFTK
jgi:multidrug resistance efflux pump